MTAVLVTDLRPLGGALVDLLLEDGVIRAVSDPTVRPALLAARPALAAFDGRGRILLPAFVDLHTHLREPGGEDAETIASGLRAAAAGGYADVFAMANTDPPTDDAARVEAMQSAAAAWPVRVHVVGAITEGLAGRTLAPLRAMADAGARMFSDDGRCVDDPLLMMQALSIAADLDLAVAQHAQSAALVGDGRIHAGLAAASTGEQPWPTAGEAALVARDAVLAAETGGSLHVCHVSTRRTVEVIRAAKARGWPVTAEVTPHHLLLTDELAALGDPIFKVNPPLRSADDVAALRDAVADGTIDALATDHAPHVAARKACGWHDAAFGMTGLETALPVLLAALRRAGPVDWHRVADLLHDGPRRIGRLGERRHSWPHAGAEATFTIVDPWTEAVVDPAAHRSAARNTPFAGMTLPGRVVATVVRQEVLAGTLT